MEVACNTCSDPKHREFKVCYSCGAKHRTPERNLACITGLRDHLCDRLGASPAAHAQRFYTKQLSHSTVHYEYWLKKLNHG